MVKKGSDVERTLVKKLWANGFAALRAPASGGATKRPLPDILAGNNKIYLAIEVKSTSKDRIYIDSLQIDDLIKFSDIFGAKPYICVKFNYVKWLFLEPVNVVRTKNGNYRIDKDFAIEKGLELDEVTGKDKQVKF